MNNEDFLKDVCPNHTEKSKWNKSELLHILELHKKQLLLQGVSKSLPTTIEIDFDGHLKCQIETTDKSPTILKAVNGYGQPVDCNKDKIRISEI